MININQFKGQFDGILDIREGEGRALLWSWLDVFALFLAYYVLRPIRDELGVAAGVDNLPWLFSATHLAMILLNPLFGYGASKWTREKFIAIAYRFFMVLLLVFIILLTMSTHTQRIWIGRGFFVFVSVWPSVAILVFAQVTRRIGNFGLSRPTREVLFTSVSREDRFNAKNFFDTVIYRAGDQLGSWTYAGLSMLVLTLAGISLVANPLSALWLVLSFWLGKRQQTLQYKLVVVPL